MNPKTKNATIGEMSIIPIGGIIRLKGSKKISVNFLKERNGSLNQLIFGNQLNKTLMSISNIIKLKSW